MKLTNLTFWLSKLLTIALILLVYEKFSQISSFSEPDYKSHTHRILYIDPTFDDEEQEFIISAAIIWTSKTNSAIKIDVIILPTEEELDTENGIIVGKSSKYNPDIIGLDTINESYTLAYFTKDGFIPSINLVTSRMSNDKYQAIVLHEIGHALGLKHNIGIDGLNTLMYPSIDRGSFIITNKDIENFCKLYRCNASKLNNQ